MMMLKAGKALLQDQGAVLSKMKKVKCWNMT
jgi:hypothetical protein